MIRTAYEGEMKIPFTRKEITDILALVADRLKVRDRWEYAAWYCQAHQNFNSPWELDGVRTSVQFYADDSVYYEFQFPLGIRWCSDATYGLRRGGGSMIFQFPLGIRWCSDCKPEQSK